MPLKLLMVLQPDDTILLQLADGDKIVGYLTLDRHRALANAENLKKLAERIPEEKKHAA